MFPHEFFAVAYFPGPYFPPVLVAVGNDVWITWAMGG